MIIYDYQDNILYAQVAVYAGGIALFFCTGVGQGYEIENKGKTQCAA